jgi:DnaA family protein
VAGNATWEEALFHFINRLREAGRGRLLVASRERLGALALGLPDLRSRLAWGLRLELQTLDEAGKREVMLRRAEALHIDLPEEVVDYLLRHGRRGMGELLFALEQLRLGAITEKRRITVPLARRVLAADAVETDSEGSRDEVPGGGAE